ncbi:MAG TPA: hypothetical protein VIG06_08635, partial [Kofleriaceae bacterium]
ATGRVGSGVVARIRMRALKTGPAEVGFALGKALGPDLSALVPLEMVAVRVQVREETRDRPGRDHDPVP